MTEPGDLLMTWISEVGAGRLQQLLEGVAWAANSHGFKTRPGAGHQWIRTMSALGHLDVDWSARVWSVSPPVVTRLPQSDGLAVVVGRRDTEDAQRIRREQQDGDTQLTVVPNPHGERDIPLPGTLVVAYSAVDEVSSLAGRLGARWVPCFALQASQHLPMLGGRGSAAAPVRGEPIERFDIRTRTYEEWSGWVIPDGLYRLRRNDHSVVYQILKDGDWYRTTREEGTYIQLDENAERPLTWRRDPATGREGVGQLVVDRSAPLPPLHHRVAVLCLGLAPLIGETAGTVVYDNVPKDIAKKIANTLNQPLPKLR